MCIRGASGTLGNYNMGGGFSDLNKLQLQNQALHSTTGILGVPVTCPPRGKGRAWATMGGAWCCLPVPVVVPPAPAEIHVIAPFTGEKTDMSHPRGWVGRPAMCSVGRHMPRLQPGWMGCPVPQERYVRKGHLTLCPVSGSNSSVHARLCSCAPYPAETRALCGASKGQ